MIRYINTKDARDGNHVIQSMKIQFIENTDFFIKIEYSYKAGMKCRSVELKGPYQCRIIVYHLEKLKRNFTMMF